MPINNKYYNGLEFRSEASEKKIVQKTIQNRTMAMHIKQAKMQHAQDLAGCKRLSWGALQQVMTKALDTEKNQNQKKWIMHQQMCQIEPQKCISEKSTDTPFMYNILNRHKTMQIANVCYREHYRSTASYD